MKKNRKRKFFWPAVFLACLAAAAAVYVTVRRSGGNPGVRDDESRMAADFVLPDLQGKRFKLSSLRGKAVLLDFWATWCGPCLEDIPGLNLLQQKYKEKGFTVLAVSLDDASTKEVAAFAQEHKLAYPVLMTGGQDKIPDGYNIFGLPAAYLIDPSGIIRRKYYGPKDMGIMAKDIEDILPHARS